MSVSYKSMASVIAVLTSKQIIKPEQPDRDSNYLAVVDGYVLKIDRDAQVRTIEYNAEVDSTIKVTYDEYWSGTYSYLQIEMKPDCLVSCVVYRKVEVWD